ncbi:polyhydroxyalkanoic acid synthase subunit PhaR [Geomicrobium sp. JSM 1781026]|uniref:hypothetical protein n=1 Tax=unclassified Geomicrobium TaxID=2628951 RepID=UPI00045F3134|nr:hypothetical protein [Geomicrobium sp. JCM 19039]GAK11782.1 polyhydroxyalkanoate synthesis repressor PhaR [Geomicrobium sp. JCM 19039]
MADKNGFDPFDMWKNLYQQYDSYWSGILDEKMREEQFSEWMGTTLEMNLLYKKMMDETMSRYLEQANVPSVDDLSKVSKLIINVDEKVDHLDDQLQDMNLTAVKSDIKREITKLKTEMKGLDEKLDTILKHVQSGASEAAATSGKS